MPRYGLLPVVLPLLAVLGCSSPAPDSDLPPGVELVESDAPLQPPGSWTVSPEPVLEIGQVEGDPRYLFSRIPQPGTVRFSDGRLAVCDNEDRTVRFFDPAGRFLSEIGGKGEGPGEFDTGITSCTRLLSGGLAAAQSHRVSYFSDDGRFARGLDVLEASVADVFLDGSALTSDLELCFDGTSIPSEPCIMPASVRLLSPDGSLSAWTLATYSHVVSPAGNGMMTTPQPFGPGRLLLLTHDGLVYGWGASAYELRYFNRSGELQRIIRRKWEPEPLTAEDHKTASHAVPPEHYAAFGRGILDPAEHVWVHRARPAGEWDVFDTAGRWVTTVTMPEALYVHAIGPDYILGVWTDGLGVQYVRMYGLERGK